MIPKKIHYCWFGRNKLPAKAVKCIASWKKYCPDYEIIEWNEDNVNLDINPYVRKCYDEKRFAFLSDYIRLKVIEEAGGIYFDTDVEVLRPMDNLLRYPAYFGFETEEYINTGLGFGAEAHNSAVIQMIKEYDVLFDGEHEVVGCPHLNTEALIKFGLERNGKTQDLSVCMVFSADFFNPFDAPTGRLRKTENTYSIHWYSASWMNTYQRIRSRVTRPLHRLQELEIFRKG